MLADKLNTTTQRGDMGLENDSMAAVDIDPAFIVSPEHRPKINNSNNISRGDQHIPVIDLSPLNSIPPEESNGETLINQIEEACKEWGFFQVINHDVPLELLRWLQSEAAKFFSLPLQEKSRVRRNMDNPFGYYDTELTKNVRDWKEVFDFACRGTINLPRDFQAESHDTRPLTNQWPENPPHLREACEKYAEAVEKLSFRLLGLISQSLGLPGGYFDSKFEEHTSFLRLNHYPRCPVPHLALGVSRHRDIGAVTVLLQDDVEGLQVKKKDGEWLTVKPVPGAFIINVGDCVQVWSNDKYESVEHRVVVNDKEERFSVPFFFTPSHHVMMAPVPELLNEDNPPKYKEFNWGRFYKRRNDSNFKNLGAENLQIHRTDLAISPYPSHSYASCNEVSMV
uniref:TSA: Wollemia nobilis Ref_Wollemi_Transcript_14009_1340 transcribed RNA sequence n=1 Tax=Wollemia nobilis TaxID=56998 RepID=A0A0C9RTA0_9CONI